MKIFDRYIILSFLKNYVLSFVVLVGLYIALDMVFNFDELTRAASTSGNETAARSALGLVYDICEFYFHQMFFFFVQLSGMIPIVAAAFTLTRLMRHNELTAMLAAGVPMIRIAAPVIAAGIVMSMLLVADQELIIPNITHKLTRDHDEVGQARGSAFPIRALEDSSGALLMAARYHPPGYDRSGKPLPPTIEEFDVIEFSADRRPLSHIRAPHAEYDATSRTWILRNGFRQKGVQPTDRAGAEPVAQWKTDLGPNEIALYRKASFVELLSLSQISGLLEHPRNYGTIPLLRVRHWRIVQPIVNTLLLLLAVASILTREPNAMKVAATRTVLVTAVCFAVVFISHQLAGRPPTPEATWYWPALMLWLPVFIFGPLAVVMLDRLKT